MRCSRGSATFVGDLPFDGLHAVFVRSHEAHGTIVGVDLDDALALDDVVAIDTDATLPLGPYVHLAALDIAQSRHPLAHGTVRHVGEAVAVVLAESEHAAVDAAELVAVDIEPLTPVVIAGDAAPLIYPGAGSNEVASIDRENVDVLGGATTVIELEIGNPRLASAPIENDGIVATPSGEGALDIVCTSQGVHIIRDDLATALGIEPTLLRVRSPAVGGAFGGRVSPPPEFAVVAALALRHGRPVRWLQSRSENLTGMPQGRGIRSKIRLGLTDDGSIVGLDVDAVADCGATAHMAALFPISIERQMTGLYRIPALGWRSRSMLSNTTPVGAYRGAGQPEANHARERLLDVAARRVGVDPVEFRRRHLLRADELPRTQPGGVTYDAADPVAALDLAVELAAVDRWRGEQHRRVTDGATHRIGVGVACFAQTTGRGNPSATASIRIEADGHVTVACGRASHGQSHAETWRSLVAARLGVAGDDISIVDADTDAVPTGGTTGGSSASQVLAAAIDGTCTDLVDAAREIAADRFEVAVDDLEIVSAGFGLSAGIAVVGVPTSRVTWGELAAEQPASCLDAIRSESVGGEAHPYGTHVSVVEVDIETGMARLLTHTAVDDCGVVLQPAFVEGQQHGGAAAGIGQALLECVSFDDAGLPETASLLFYLLPTAPDLPMFTTATMSTPTERNALGTRGIGENGCNGATAAVHNAVVDALAPLGVEHVDLPLTPERIWRAIDAADR